MNNSDMQYLSDTAWDSIISDMYPNANDDEIEKEILDIEYE